jgi:hypothetical protein
MTTTSEQPDSPTTADLQKQIGEQVVAHISPRIDRFYQNASRVASLIALYENLSTRKDPIDHSDILRAAVVLLHATLEDFLRGLAGSHLPLAGESALNTVPLANTTTGRPEKFLLGRLAAHRGKTVDQLLQESVDQFLERSNFNSSDEIAALLTNLGLDIDGIRPTFARLDPLMRRRHQIVHRADMFRPTAEEPEVAQPITAPEVKEWADAARVFLSKTLSSLSIADIKTGRLQLGVPLEFTRKNT